MNCIKCGLEIEEGRVFCDSCLEIAAKYPVKPGIAIQLPGKKDSPSPKKSHSKRRQVSTVEDQLQKLKKRMRIILLLWLLTLMLLACTIYPTVKYFDGKVLLLPGQNYTTITDTDPTGP